MELNIRAGMRVLYKKNNSNWLVGEIAEGNAAVNEHGLYIPIWAEKELEAVHSKSYTWDEPDCTLININDIFFDAIKLEDWIKNYPDYFMTKENYIKFIENEDFDKHIEHAWLSDGEYYYYPINKYNRMWLEKQPFNYVVRSD